MRITEATAAEMEPAMRHRRAGGSLARACLIAVALASHDAVAQTTSIEVTLLPGETSRSIAAPVGTNFSLVYIAAEEYVCNLPTEAQANYRLLFLAGMGTLQSTLTGIEGEGTATALAIRRAFNLLALPGDRALGGVFSRATQAVSRGALVNGPYTVTFASDCLTVTEARAAINDIRRIIRAHLGLPAPAN